MLKPKKGEIRKPTKTISGITPVAVMLPPRKCEHGACVYCPNLDVPQSYTPRSPVVLRAMNVDYDAFTQVKERLKAFRVMNHPTDKIELIIMGGTFLQYPKKFQYKYIKRCYDALNNKKSKTLEEAKKLNETAVHRCVALCIETRPDECVKYIPDLLEFGCTRVELGVQIIDDKIYKKINRGHTVKDVVDTTKALKNAGFKIGYHIMPGLPGSNMKKDLELFKKLFGDERFKPDQLKLYPCQVMPGSKLEEMYWNRKYKPYVRVDIERILIDMIKNTPRYTRIMRVMREIPPEYIVAGTRRIDLRAEIERNLRDSESSSASNTFSRTKGTKKKEQMIKEIRFREIGFALRDKREVNLDLSLKVTKYKASKGTEYFLEIVNKDDVLFGLLRLRISGKRLSRSASSKNQSNAIIRELHVYGQALKIGQKLKIASQHQGLGKWLIEEAENIVKKSKIKKLSIISGVGVREYYRRLGYKLEDSYMVRTWK